VYEHIPKTSIVVQKYGGTSVGNLEKIQAIADRVVSQVNAGWTRLAIVVSAMAGETNRLVGMVEQIHPKARSKSYDMAIAAGEQVSVGLMAAALEAKGLRAEPLLGYQLGVLTDEHHSRARIHSIQTDKIHQAWARGEIPVVAGFQGMASNQAITTLGRGGSDTSAVALAVALNAAFCEIDTDVDGVFTADPRLVKHAKLIERLEYDVALELAASGGKVLHNRCVELAAKNRLPLVVRNTFAPETGGRTVIMAFDEKEALEAPLVSGVTLDKDVAKVTLRNWRKENGPLLNVFSRVAKKGVNVDIIIYDAPDKTGSASVGFSVPDSELHLVREVIETFKSETGGTGLEMESLGGLAKISAVGLGMRSQSGVASRLFESLSRAEIEILMISTSEIKISCVVHADQAQKVMQTIHDTFL